MTNLHQQWQQATEMLENLTPHWPIHYNDILRIMISIFPEMELGEDHDGQLIIYTGLESCSSDGYYAPDGHGPPHKEKDE